MALLDKIRHDIKEALESLNQLNPDADHVDRSNVAVSVLRHCGANKIQIQERSLGTTQISCTIDGNPVYVCHSTKFELLSVSKNPPTVGAPISTSRKKETKTEKLLSLICSRRS